MEFLFFFYNSSTLHSVLVNSEVTYSIRNIFILIFVINTVFMYIMVFILSETGGVWNFFLIGQNRSTNQRSGMILEVQIQIFQITVCF